MKAEGLIREATKDLVGMFVMLNLETKDCESSNL